MIIEKKDYAVRIGERFGFLVVKSNPWYVMHGKRKYQRALFACDCGAEKEIDCRAVVHINPARGKTTNACSMYCRTLPYRGEGTLLDENGEKVCSKCFKKLPASKFYKCKHYKDGLEVRCTDCDYDKKLQKLFGITLTDYNELLTKQNHVCALCGKRPKKKRLSVDHCHKTGKVRGLLCGNCNTAIGLFKDNPIVLEKAIAYLA